jgi:hypothetical protein
MRAATIQAVILPLGMSQQKKNALVATKLCSKRMEKNTKYIA